MTMVKIKVLSAFTLPGGKVAEAGTIITVEPLVAYDLPASKAQMLDPLRAKALMDVAVTAANVEALRIEKQNQPRGPAVSSWVLPSRHDYLSAIN